MITTTDVFNFLSRNPALTYQVIEQEAGIPSRTLSKAKQSGKEIPSHHLPKLYPILIRYGYNEDKKAVIISIVNNKGGVGKTTSTINIGKALSLQGKEVLLVDLDSQGNLSQNFSNEPTHEIQVIDALLKGKELPIIQIDERISYVPSGIKMTYAEQELVTAIGGERRLTLQLSKQIASFDYILLDCPPSLNIITTNALVASDYALIPMQPEAASVYGLENLMERIFEIRNYSNPRLKILGILITMVQNQVVHKQFIEMIRSNYGKDFHVFSQVIDNGTVVKQSQALQQDLYTYAAESKIWKQYEALTAEMLTLI